MEFILISVEAIVSTVGALAAAALLCWVLWHAFKLALHPEWAAAAVPMLLGLALVGALPASEFLKMTLMFAVIAAVPLWIAGRAWHGQSRQDLDGAPGQELVPDHDDPAEPTSAPLFDLYPAISACIRENRSPTREEVHLVAARLWREGLAQRFGSPSQPASFAARRVTLRTARAVLSGGSRCQGDERIRAEAGSWMITRIGAADDRQV